MKRENKSELLTVETTSRQEIWGSTEQSTYSKSSLSLLLEELSQILSELLGRHYWHSGSMTGNKHARPSKLQISMWNIYIYIMFLQPFQTSAENFNSVNFVHYRNHEVLAHFGSSGGSGGRR